MVVVLRAQDLFCTLNGLMNVHKRVQLLYMTGTNVFRLADQHRHTNVSMACAMFLITLL